MTPSRDIARLIEIMAALRTPITGCPWDLEQNFQTIAPYTIEEAYEVADAIQRRDLADLKDELGDLLLQVVYHARMAEEERAFAFGDVVEGVTRKMIRRHPHVFGDGTARSAADVDGLWAKIKAEERAEKAAERAKLSASDSAAAVHGSIQNAPTSILSDVPISLPALTRAIKLQDKAAKVGFDWPNLAPVFDKLKEELEELEEAIAASAKHVSAQHEANSQKKNSAAAIQEEFGDLLFVMANIARHLKIDPEDALRSANAKFTRRFAHIESRLAEKGSAPVQSTLQEMDALWDEAKTQERKG
ncbi:MAG: nucleoside triphosphate pyrophosphohydrolase [Hyphomicrobium sp.]|nr:MAG: nucleoside triphosphate pyrophosphohydrolase [Hyphomicrobium sp.]PPD00101.1 MAG: nucleoside triphosphate pyrophosphohydrolase [Hyphomicrobium sp.]